MNIEFLDEQTVQLTVELHSTYKKDWENRISVNTADAKEAFLKEYPNKRIKAILKKDKINNFRQNGIVEGKWIFRIAAPSSETRKNKKAAAAKKSPRAKK